MSLPLRTVPFFKGWHPAVRRMGQLVEVRPEVKVEAPIKVELGGLPLTLGLFAGSAVAFLIRSGVPKGWPQTVATAAGALLALGGVGNLLFPKAATPTAVTPSPGGAPATLPGVTAAASQGYAPSQEVAFGNVVGRIVSPADFSTVDIGPFASGYPVRLQLQNRAEVPVSFEIELTADEAPHPVGGELVSSLPIQMSLSANQIRDLDIVVPIGSWGALVDYVDVVLTAKKRRGPGEAAVLMDQRSFVVE